jgi:hypothetical protein
MYLLFLLVAAFLIVSILGSNWPLKLFHSWTIQKIAREFGTEPVYHGLLSPVVSEIKTIYKGSELRIRFVERPLDSLSRTDSGLEIRIAGSSRFILECYRPWHRKREWGNFKQFRSNEGRIDSEWFLLTPEPERVAALWDDLNMGILLDNKALDQILFNRKELIVRVRRSFSGPIIRELVDHLMQVFHADTNDKTIDV